jgi:hypothetical protein
MSYRDAVECTRVLQRFVAEIHALIVWGYSLLGRTLNDNGSVPPCFRGIYVSSLADFNRLSTYGLSLFSSLTLTNSARSIAHGSLFIIGDVITD